MINENQNAILNEIAILSKLPMDVSDSEGNLLALFPSSGKEFFRSEYRAMLIRALQSCKYPDGIMILCMQNTFYNAVTKVGEDLYLITYPVVTSLPAEGALFSSPGLSTVRQWIDAKLQPEFFQLTMELPILSTAYLERVTDLAKKVCLGESAHGTCLVYTEDFERFTQFNPAIPTEQEPEPYDELTPAAFAEHDSPYWENQILAAISEGNESQLTGLMKSRVREQIGKMSLNPLRQEKYMFICFAYAVSRAAIRGGLSHEIAFRVSDNCCQKMDQLTSPAQIRALRAEMALDYCRRVAAIKKCSHSTLKCCAYIRSHIYEEFSVDDLAAATHLNRHSLSDYFKRDMGVSIQDYVSNARLEEARHLLLDSDMSLADISALLCYSTQSYFCKKFREKYGTTPQKYRSEHGKE